MTDARSESDLPKRWRKISDFYIGPHPSGWLLRMIERSGLRIAYGDACYWLEAPDARI